MESDETSCAAPRLSVVVPVYRVEAYLATCLDSILAEAGGDVEVVAVDDGSPDRSG
ncbi:MAG: glycosyltransferase, partial [Micromonosporaceae bacterium]|nr:glycosyltransferase [Micromonosporaceae bacterium]